jgi:hypothetical protein
VRCILDENHESFQYPSLHCAPLLRLITRTLLLHHPPPTFPLPITNNDIKKHPLYLNPSLPANTHQGTWSNVKTL